MANVYRKNRYQHDAYTSPWKRSEAIKIRVWEVVWTLFVRWLPKLCYRWHIMLLKLFGCHIHGKPFIATTARIYAPWLLSIEDRACLGTRCEVYNLGPVRIGARATVAQYAYLCNGTHDLNDPNLPLMVGDMRIEADVFIGARAMVLPGLTIGEGAVVGGGAVVTKDVEPWMVVGGNPAKVIKERKMDK